MASTPASPRRRFSIVARGAPLLAFAAFAAFAGASASACYEFSADLAKEAGEPAKKAGEPAKEAGEPAKEAGEPAKEAGAGASDACVTGGSYCGGDRLVGKGDTIYRCTADGGGALTKKCAAGCSRDAGDGARCKLPEFPCQAGGNYCGGDKLDGDPRILYRCAANGAHTILERCTKGCVVMRQGTDDDCAP